MAAVHENQLGRRRRRTRQIDGRRSQVRVCTVCGCQTRWVSVEGTCWKCTVSIAKQKKPLFIEPEDEESGSEFSPDPLVKFPKLRS
jgi:hypothetical protein